jgi:predicted transcriptional regulator
MIEIVQALIYHYAVLVNETDTGVGITTRTDFLRLLGKEEQ